MKGQFIFATCNIAGVGIRAYLRNIPRIGETEVLDLRREGIRVDLQVFSRGKRIVHQPNFGTVPLGGILEIPEQFLGSHAAGEERVIKAVCSLGGIENQFFPQEHQITYVDPKSGLFASLLYDQLPVPPAGKPGSPIVLLAPKIWIGSGLNTFVIFANGSENQGPQAAPLWIGLLSQSGQLVREIEYQMDYNDVKIVNVASLFPDKDLSSEPLEFYSLVARGGSSSLAIKTLIRNLETGSLALEHSLSPHYYSSGDLARVRKEALLFK